MLTRKDLLQAHRLGTQRAALALISGEPDDPERPLRRMSVATFSGVMVAVIVAAAFGVIGLVRPGGAKGLDQAGMLIIEKETGARYVWCGTNGDKQLCQVENYASARLLAGADDKSRRTVSRNSLKGFARGPEIGIPGAPNTVPDPKQLVKSPWLVCVRSVDNGISGTTSTVTLLAGSTGSNVGGTQLGDTQAVVVQASGQPWLIWRNKRMRLPSYAVRTLGAGNPVQVADKWLNSLPAAADYVAPDVPGLGQLPPDAAKRPNGQGRIGQVYDVKAATGDTWYVLLSDGLAQISEIEKELMLANPATKKAYPPGETVAAKPLDASTANGVISSQQITKPELLGKPPSAFPYTDTIALCAVYADPTGNGGPVVTLGATLPAPSASAASTGVDLRFPPGGAAVAGLVSSGNRASQVGTYFLVADGRRFAFKSPDTAQKFGYQLPGDAAPVQAGVLDLIPQGPVLDPDKAALPVVAASPQPVASPPS
jgi:type VII secretion protein EccB